MDGDCFYLRGKWLLCGFLWWRLWLMQLLLLRQTIRMMLLVAPIAVLVNRTIHTIGRVDIGNRSNLSWHVICSCNENIIVISYRIWTWHVAMTSIVNMWQIPYTFSWTKKHKLTIYSISRTGKQFQKWHEYDNDECMAHSEACSNQILKTF